MKETQLQWVKDELREKGTVTRNQALKRYVSRLGARIADLRIAGWKIEGKWQRTEHGNDYVYTLLDAPKQLVERVVERDGKYLIVNEYK